jgi:hypothetical protein
MNSATRLAVRSVTADALAPLFARLCLLWHHIKLVILADVCRKALVESRVERSSEPLQFDDAARAVRENLERRHMKLQRYPYCAGSPPVRQ